MRYVRRDLGQRLQHKPPCVHQRMWNLQFIRIHNLIAVKQQIEIDQSRRPFLAAHAAEVALDLEKPRQEITRRKRRVNFRRRIEKWR